MDKTRQSANLVSENNIFSDITNNRVGIATTNPTSTLQVIGDATISGVVTASSFVGNLTGTASTATEAGTAYGLSGTSNLNVGIVTATSFYGDLTGTASTATALETLRTFEITGDVVASPISFDGSSNVSLAATIQPNSVGLGTDTVGDYVSNITGTANQITVTSGTGEGSTPTLSVPSQFTAPEDVRIIRDLQVDRDLNVNGNITIGGTSASLFTTELKVFDPDIVLGIRTDENGEDISTDNTANHGGIAIASTEGTPLISLYDVGIGETNPATYKKIMWFKSGTFSGLGTDAWLINYGVGIGSTQVPDGVRLSAGGMQVTDSTISAPQLNISGIVTARSGIVLGPTANTIQLGTGTTISSPSSDTFTILTGGSERVRVDSSGRLAVGTTSPSFVSGYTGLQVDGGSNGPVLKLTNSTTGSTSTDGFDIILQQGGSDAYIWQRESAPLIFGTAATERGRITSTGNFGLGTSSPDSYAKLAVFGVQNVATYGDVSAIFSDGVTGSARFHHASGNVKFSSDSALAFGSGASATERARISSAGGFSVGTTADPGVGAIYATGDITAFYSSDIRLKKDIEPISEPIKKLMEISGVTYKWNEEYLKDKDVDGYFVRETEVGVIAQDVEKVLPEVVATRENGYKAVRYEKLVALLIEAVKDQQKQIDELKARLEEV